MADPLVMVVSGTSRGLGRGIAEHFAKAGYRVAGCSRGTSTIDLDLYEHHQVNVTDESQVQSWVRGIKRSLGKIDVLVCNAGVVPDAALVTLTSSHVVRTTMQTNVEGTFLLCREVGKVMIPQRSGSIITISSMAVAVHQRGTAAYSASKAAIVELTKVLASELAAFGITCNSLAPSVFRTKNIDKMGGAGEAATLESLTIKRELQPNEVCNAIAFFASPLSRAITGQTIHMGLVC